MLDDLDLPDRPTIDVARFAWPGPVSRAFGLDDATPIAAIMGPQGGGKTTSCCFKLLRKARRMPACIDGVRRLRFLCVRDTYDRLYRSAVASWLSIVPKAAGKWEGGQGRPARHLVTWTTPRGLVEVDGMFIAIGDQAAEDVMRGFEFGALWLNEGDRLAEDVLVYGVGRGFRYPAKSTFPPGVEPDLQTIIDLNAPDIDSWFYKRFVEDPQAGHKLYRQPSGRSAGAENLANLAGGRAYYDRQIMLNASRPDWVRRMVDNEFGYSRDGEPVYPEFSDQVHVASASIPYTDGVPVVIGLDQGLHPAAVFIQPMPGGQVRVIAEIDPGRMGVERFKDLVLREVARIPTGCSIAAFADPAGFYGADKESGEIAWAEMLSLALQIQILPAPSNELSLRIGAVQLLLQRTLLGGEPAFLLSPECRRLRRGLNSGYQFRRVQNARRQYEDKPEKNDFSHTQDGLQYAALGVLGRAAVVGGMAPIGDDRRSGRRAAASPVAIKSDWNPLDA